MYNYTSILKICFKYSLKYNYFIVNLFSGITSTTPRKYLDILTTNIYKNNIIYIDNSK